jgi:hypothetical protein
VPILAASCSLYSVWKGFSARSGFAKMRPLRRFPRPTTNVECVSRVRRFRSGLLWR